MSDFDRDLANNGHDPAEAKDADEFDTRAKSWLHGVSIDNSFNLMEALDQIVLIPSVDPVKTDLEVHCHGELHEDGRVPCGTHLCDAEAHDTLATLVRVAVAHYEEVHAR